MITVRPSTSGQHVLVESMAGRLDDRRTMAAVVLCVAVAISSAIAAAWIDSSVDAYRSSEIISAITTAVSAVVGAMVALAVPRNRIGWLVLALAVTSGLGEGLTEAGVHGVHTAPGSVPAAGWFVMIGVLFRTLSGLLGLAVVPAYFPDGQLPPGRWRYVGVVLLAAIATTVASSILAPIETRLGDHWRGPLTPIKDPSNTPLEGLNVLAALLMLVGGVMAAGGLVARWRRGGPIMRQQLLLFVSAVIVDAMFLAGVLGYVIITPNTPPRSAFGLLGLPLPIAIAAATLNHGLYDLRRTANRTLLVLLLGSTASAVYVATVLLATQVVPDRKTVWAPAIAATIAATALIPLRARLQRVVNRVVYGRWHDPYGLLSELGGRLSAAADLDRLLAETTAELRSELDLRALAITDSSGTVIVGEPRPNADTVALTAYGHNVGTLSIDAGRELSDQEQQLVLDLAGNIGNALHTKHVLSALQSTRERLVLSREEERRRLRRDLHDGIGPALAGLTLKAETAQALLPPGNEQVADQLAALSDEIRATVTDVRRLVEGLRPPALDELGLLEACRQSISRLAQGSGITVTVSAHDLPELPAAVEVAAYRIVQEAATNTIRHAAAETLDVVITVSESTLTVSIADDGIGLRPAAGQTPAEGGNGLTTMAERAQELGGTFDISARGRGTQVEAALPLNPSTIALQKQGPQQ